MFEKWLICNIYKGMFTDEWAIRYKSSSFFVPKKHVKAARAGGEGKVRVKTFVSDNTHFAVLPTDDQKIIRVAQSDLS